MRRSFLVAVALGILPVAVSHASEHKPHPVAPILKPIVSRPDPVEVTKEEQQILKAGKPVLRQRKNSETGSGVAIQEIAAPQEYVWRTIMSHHRYAEWVKNIEACEVYKKDGRLLYIGMLTSFLMFRSQLYMIHRIQRPFGYISWTLDRSRTSDLDDVIGYWQISQVSENPPRTRLEYGSAIVANGMPDFVIAFLTRDSLLDGTAWVKEQSEIAWQASKH